MTLEVFEAAKMATTMRASPRLLLANRGRIKGLGCLRIHFENKLDLFLPPKVRSKDERALQNLLHRVSMYGGDLSQHGDSLERH